MKKRYTVLIPLVNPAENTSNHDLLEIYSDPYQYNEDFEEFLKQELKSISKGWERITARLRAINLQASAHNAVEAARKLGLSKYPLSLYQFFKPQAWLERQRLGVVNPVRVSEGDSAELGLALVLLISASGSKHTQIIATGKLRAQGPKIHDVEVLPVAGVEEKLRFLSLARMQGNLPEKPLLCFTPLHYFKADGEIGNVCDLPEFELLKKRNIEIVPIGWLSEAMTYMRIYATRNMAADRLLVAALSFMITGTMIFSLYQYELWREIPLEWVFPFKKQGQPFQVCLNKKGESKNLTYLAIDQHGKQSIAPETVMGWYLELNPNYYDILRPENGYLVTNILVGEISDIVVYQNTKNSPFLNNRQPYYSWISIGSQEEDRVLIVLVSREMLDPNQIKDEFNLKFQRNPITHTFELNSAVNFLMKKAPGKIMYSFTQTKKFSDGCPE